MAEIATKEPAAPAAEETFEIDELETETPELDETEALEVPADEPDPEPVAKTEEPERKPEPKVEAKPEPKPDPKPEPKAEDAPRRLDPIAREERDKRKKYAALYAEAKDQIEDLQAQVRTLRSAQDPTKDPDLQRWHAELIAEADKSTEMSGPLKAALKEIQRRDIVLRREINLQMYQVQCDYSDRIARMKYKDFEQVLAKAGIYDAIKTGADGKFVDASIANRVYYNRDGSLCPDPAERMYRLAIGKLEYERQQRGEPEEEVEVVESPRNGARVERVEDTGKKVAEAERRGAERVIEAVAKNSTRHQGIRQLPKAKGTSSFTRPQLDKMSEDQPEAYAKLMERRPDLERWHLGG